MATDVTSKPAWVPNPAFPEQNEDGVDLSLIRQNLRLTPVERIRRGDDGRRTAVLLRSHARRIGPAKVKV